MGFVKTKTELDFYYGLGMRKFFDAEMLGVMFETKPEIIARLLPPPLEPDVPNGLLFIARYPQTNLGPGYREAALFIRCQYRGEAGSYCLAMPIESEESRLYNGRDIFGFPKKLARIHLERRGDAATGWVERHGVRFVEVNAKFSGRLPQMPAQGPNFLFKGMPKIDLSPGFDGPVLLCRHQTAVEMKSMEIGSAEVRYQPSEDDPWSEVEVVKVLAGFYLVSDNTMPPGKVLAEVDGDAYLPYYYKITDLYKG